MARLFSYQDGSFTAANGWKLIDSTSFLNSVAGSTATTTSFVASTAFTPGAITVEGIGLFIANRAASPSGTFDVQLWNSTGGVQVALVTINSSDLTSSGTQYAYFKFAAPVLLLAATNYQVRVRSSVASQVTLYRDATAGNWTRFLVTPTTATMAVGNEEFFVMGDHTGAGTFNTRTMTMDVNSTNNHFYLIAGNHGIINWNTSANTELRLNTEYISGSTTSTILSGNSEMNIGSSGSPLSSSFTATYYQIATGTGNRAMLLVGRSAFRAYGAPRKRITTARNNITAGATSFTSNDTLTNWAIGDQVVFTGTQRATSQTELRTLTGVTSNTGSWTGGLTNARQGNVMTGAAADFVPGNIAAHAGNLTSNIKMRGVSTTSTFRIVNSQGTTIEFDNVEIFNHGGTGNGSIQDSSLTSTTNISNSSFYNGSAAATIVVAYTATAFKTTGSINLSNNVFYDFQIGGFSITNTALHTGTPTNSTTIDDNLFVTGLNTGGYGVNSTINPLTLRRNIFNDIRTTTFWTINLSAAASLSPIDSYEISGNIVYCCVNAATIAARNNKDSGFNWGSNVYFRNTAFGGYVYGSYNSRINSDRAFGNTTANWGIGTPGVADSIDVEYIGLVLSGESSFASQIGISLADSAATTGASYTEATFTNCSIGVASGSAVSHTSADISYRTADTSVVQGNKLKFDDCSLGSTVKILNQTRMTRGSYINFRNFNATNNDHRSYHKNGILQTDTTIVRSSPRSARMTPSSATLSTDFANRKYALKAGQSATVGCYIRTSVVGDGAAYNGSLPQIILKRNYALGITTDSVIGTATVASSGAWELVTGSIPAVSIDGVVEIAIRANGTTGWVNVEDFK